MLERRRPGAGQRDRDFASGGAYIFSITNTVGTVSGQTFCYASTHGTVTPIAAPLTGYRPSC